MIFVNEVNPVNYDQGIKVVNFKRGRDRYIWSAERTGDRRGNDDDIEYETVLMLKKSTGEVIVNETRYISEYSDNKVEFMNTCRDFCEGDFGNIIEKMTY